ncbi:hypothetical protein D6829_00740 [Candidatus Pacearchaeota archaeon]|nr:MAG: hypothetical protein D6829_00740 [Candidatus Pacearchaeota archaeon]
MPKKGIPKRILKELDIHKKEKIQTKFKVTAVVERHQVKLPVPSRIRQEIPFKKGQKLVVHYDQKTKSLIYSFKC